jgi:hypothetical protein
MPVDKPAELEAPVLGTDEPTEVTVVQPTISQADVVAAQVGVDKAFKAIKAQPTEKIRVPKIMGPQVVIINGARFNVPANIYVEVPQQVAQILRDADRI